MMRQLHKGEEWDHILAWAERVSQPLAENNGWPICPYARRAMVSKSIKVWRAEDYNDLVKIAQQFEHRAWAIDVVIFPRADNLEQMASDITYNFEPQNVIALADYPNKHGDIAGHNPSNGRYPVILLQDRDDLMHKRASLKSTNYYTTWAEWYKSYVLDAV